jgi:CubicO group peptidase (beta-lactamase class C family)
MRSWKVLPATLVLMAGTAAAQAPASPPADAAFRHDFDTFLDDAAARLPSMTALSIAVARRDGPVETRALGYADIARRIHATPDTPFYIASSTKSFVALALEVLAQRHVIDLDWTLARLAPDIAFDPALHADKVTLRDMLSHTSGLRNDAFGFRMAYSGEHDTRTMWRLLARTAPNGEAPLGTFHYTNLGYNIATLLLERKLHRRWQEIVRDEVLAPLGLNQSHVEGLARLTAPAPALPYLGAAPHGPELLPLLKIDATMQSAGGMVSSARDLARWLTVQLAAEQGGATAMDAAVRATHRPVAQMDERFAMYRRAGYGLGWYVGDYDGAPLYHAFGGYSGFRAHVSFMPARDIGVAIVTNDEAIGARFVDVAAAWVYDDAAHGVVYARQRAEPEIVKLVAMQSALAERFAAERAKRAARPSLLSQPLPAYAGRYCNADYGAVTVTPAGGALAFRLGHLHAVSEPFTRPDSVRVELVPNDGQSVGFATDRAGHVTSLAMLDATFRRCGSALPR